MASGAHYDEVFAGPAHSLRNSIIICAVFLAIFVGNCSLAPQPNICQAVLKTSNTMVAIAGESGLHPPDRSERRGRDRAGWKRRSTCWSTKLRETFGTIVAGNQQVSDAVERVKQISGNIVTNATEQAQRAQDVLKRIETMGQTAGEVQQNALESQQSYGDTTLSRSPS